MAAVVLVVLMLAAVAAATTQAAAVAAKHEFRIPVGQPLESLPGSGILNPKQLNTNVSITLLPLHISALPTVQFTVPAYRDDRAGLVLPFGPTIRVKRGGEYFIHLRNALPAESSANISQLTQLAQRERSKNGTTNWWQHSMMTNLHTHGMHTDTGVPSQAFAASGTYRDGDNPFFHLASGSNASVTVKIKVPLNHLPGLHWAHPHIHGSTVLQTGTAHLAIVVEDDNALWLPPENGCSDLADVLSAAPDTILDLQLYFFRKPNPLNGTYNARLTQALSGLNLTAAELSKVVGVTSNLNNGNYQYMSRQANNPLCCDDKGASTAAAPELRDQGISGAAQPISGKAIQGRGENVYTLNGAFQPAISIASNSWARWRILNSAAKGFTVVKIVDAATNQTAQDCELMLLAKDGVYLQQIPRKIEGMLLSAANRAELLVRCSGEPGKQYYLWAGGSAPFSSHNFNDDEAAAIDHMSRHLYFKQDVLATIIVTDSSNAGAASTSSSSTAVSKATGGSSNTAQFLTFSSGGVLQRLLQERACTPRRPPYAADLRDASLAANSVKTSKLVNLTTGFRAKYLPAPLVKNLFMQWGCGIMKSADLEPGREREYHEFTLPDPEPLTFPLGSIMNINMFNMEFHPVHYHINPFMIAELAEERLCSNDTNPEQKLCSFSSYFEPGDYHDTLTLPMMLHSPFYEHPTAIRFQPGEYSGYSLMHCHFLHHEDTGCMSVVHWQCPTQPADHQEGPCPGFAWPVPGDVDMDGQVVAKQALPGGRDGSSSQHAASRQQQSGSMAATSWHWLQQLLVCVTISCLAAIFWV